MISGSSAEILPVHHRVDGERHAKLRDQPRNFQLLLMRAGIMADIVGMAGISALQADLHMAKPGLRVGRKLRLVQQHGGGDEIRVKPLLRRMGDQRREILPQGWLTAGEMDLQHAHSGGLADYTAPEIRITLRPRLQHLQRIGAIRALQRAAMGEFGHHREGRGNRNWHIVHNVTKAASARLSKKSLTSLLISSSGA